MEALKDIYQNYFLMGNIYTPQMPMTKTGELMSQQFNVVTPENIMKPALIQRAQGVFTFDRADEMMAFAQREELEVVGHTLVWHQQSIGWIDESQTTKSEAIEYLRAHIEAVMGRYKGQIIAWDVVNEAFEDGIKKDTKDWRAHLRDTKWLRLLGSDYIRHAFEIAHEVDPKAILYYNDYNLNYQMKAEATYYMVKELKELGVPIQGIGMQGHYHTSMPISSVENSLELFSQLEGIEVSFTEVDVTITGAENCEVITKEQEILQGQVYAQLFQIFKTYRHLIKRVTFWGSDDATSWRSSRFPTLFNGDLSPKLAFYAVANPEKFLNEYPVTEQQEPQLAMGSYGAPKLSEILDEAWSDVSTITIDRQVTAWEGATAKAKVMWDENHLYVLIDVKTKALNNKAKELYNRDSIEVFLNQNNEKKSFYEVGDSQVTVTFENDVNIKGQAAMETFESLTTQIEEGYRVQMKLPLLEKAYEGRVLGFDLQVNDSNASGVRQSIAKWNDLTDNSWQSAENWGNLKLTR